MRGKGESMIRRVTATIGLCALLALGASSVGAAGRGPTVEQLLNAGWSCPFVAPEPTPLLHCLAPGVDLAAAPPYFNLLVFDATGAFLGSEAVLRADLYHGQPCPQAISGEFHPTPFGYFACHHFEAP